MDNNTERFFFEYGNYKLRIPNIKKRMSNIISIMSKIDKIFCEYIKTCADVDYKKLFDKTQNKTYKYVLSSGTIYSLNGAVKVKIVNTAKYYKICEVSFINIINMNITMDDLFIHRIPKLTSIVKHSKNIYHVLKTTTLLNIPNKYSVVETVSNNNSFKTFLANSTIKKNELINKKKLLKCDINNALYIKMCNNDGFGLFIKNDVLYYTIVNIDDDNNFISIRNMKVDFDIETGLI